MKFETALKNLEAIIKQFENQDLSLEESLKNYETGSQLIHFCQSELSKVENKVFILRNKINQNLKEIDSSKKQNDLKDTPNIPQDNEKKNTKPHETKTKVSLNSKSKTIDSKKKDLASSQEISTNTKNINEKNESQENHLNDFDLFEF